MLDLKTNTALNDLKSFLSKLFQFESADLDFGIYKILHYKKAEVENFIDQLLTEKVREQLNIIATVENEKLSAQVKELELSSNINKYLEAVKKKDTGRIEIYEEDFKTDIDKYKSLKAQLEHQISTTNAEPLIYNHLTIFLSRYYDKGDFISKRRYGKTEKYVVPYNGEETYFHWANADQYYIKSSELFRKYSFRVPAPNGHCNVYFKLKEANEENGNTKSLNNKFFIIAENPVEATENEVSIFFEFRALANTEKEGKGKNQDELNAYSLPVIAKSLGKHIVMAELNKTVNEKTKLALELNRYTARNRYDFFIHKDLKGFLNRELDFYIKSELLKLDDLTVFDTETHYEKIKLQFSIIKTFKSIASTIIDFISQVEDFQKKLWEKKKFVISTEYVITLDKLAAFTSAEFTESIIAEVIANVAQVKEWKELFGEEILPDWKNLNHEQLKNGMFELKKLPIDTVHFPDEFKWRLLCKISEKEKLDEVSDGLIINSDNFHALQLLQEKYWQKIKCIYTDPPYNTNASEIIYKNNFKHSSWASLIENRIEIGKELLEDTGIFCVTIDHVELKTLQNIIGKSFSEDNLLGIISILNNPSGRSTVKGVSIANEFAIIVGKTELAKIGFLPRTEKQQKQYDEQDENGSFQWRYFLRAGGANDIREARPKLFYPLIIIDFNVVRIPEMTWDANNKKWNLMESLKSNEQIIYPISNGIEYTWRLGVDTLIKRFADIRTRKSKNENQIIEIKFYEGEDGVLPKTMWLEKFYNASAYGTSLLRNLFGEAQLFSFPKSVFAVKDCLRISGLNEEGITLDYFAGSGTTFHAVQLLNNEDGLFRKCILVEQGEYVYLVTIPRIKKVAYSFDWNEGKPQNENGLGIFFKYQRLEQYEESLENIAFTSANDTAQTQLQFKDYIPKYFLHFETATSKTFMNLDAFQNPFSYSLKVFDNYNYIEQTVDVVETFNYLIGLHLHGYKRLRNQQKEYLFVTGADRQNRRIAIVWRDATGLDFEKDRDFIRQTLSGSNYDVLYANNQCAIEGAIMIEEVFNHRMS